MKKIHPKTFSELRQERYFKHRTNDFTSLKSALSEKVNEDWIERHIQKQNTNVFTPWWKVQCPELLKNHRKEGKLKDKEKAMKKEKVVTKGRDCPLK